MTDKEIKLLINLVKGILNFFIIIFNFKPTGGGGSSELQQRYDERERHFNWYAGESKSERTKRIKSMLSNDIKNERADEAYSKREVNYYNKIVKTTKNHPSTFKGIKEKAETLMQSEVIQKIINTDDTDDISDIDSFDLSENLYDELANSIYDLPMKVKTILEGISSEEDNDNYSRYYYKGISDDLCELNRLNKYVFPEYKKEITKVIGLAKNFVAVAKINAGEITDEMAA